MKASDSRRNTINFRRWQSVNLCIRYLCSFLNRLIARCHWERRILLFRPWSNFVFMAFRGSQEINYLRYTANSDLAPRALAFFYLEALSTWRLITRILANLSTASTDLVL